MSFWIIITTIGGIFSLIGILVLIRRYLRGEINQLYLFSIIIGYLSFIAFVFVNNVYPESVSGLMKVIILLPAIIAVVVLVNQIQKSKKIPY